MWAELFHEFRKVAQQIIWICTGYCYSVDNQSENSIADNNQSENSKADNDPTKPVYSLWVF